MAPMGECKDRSRIVPYKRSGPVRKLSRSLVKVALGPKAILFGTGSRPGGIVVIPHGIVVIPHGIVVIPHGIVVVPHGIVVVPHGIVIVPPGTASVPRGIVVRPYGT